jgi:hypothetical protein
MQLAHQSAVARLEAGAYEAMTDRIWGKTSDGQERSEETELLPMFNPYGRAGYYYGLALGLLIGRGSAR